MGRSVEENRENAGSDLEKRHVEIEARIGLDSRAKVKRIISSLEITWARGVSDTRYQSSNRFCVFSEEVNTSGNKPKYKSVTVIEAPEGSIVRYKEPLKENDEMQFFSAMQENQIRFDPKSDKSRTKAIESALIQLNVNPDIQIFSPTFIKERWMRDVQMSDGTIVEIAGDRCEILKEQSIAEYRRFAGDKLKVIEIELKPPFIPGHYDSLLRANRMVESGLRRQGIQPTKDAQSKSDWLKRMLLKQGMLSPLSKRDRQAA